MFKLNHSSILMALVLDVNSQKSVPSKYRFHSPLTPNSPKHSALGIARVIPLTAVFGGRRVQPFKELEYTYKRALHMYINLVLIAKCSKVQCKAW